MRLDLPTEKLIAEIDGPIGWLIYNHPERRNAISVEMQAALPSIIERFQEDPQVRVVVIKGAGERAFISGADISEFDTKRASAEQQRVYSRAGVQVFKSMASLEKPIVAMIHGFCLGAGVATALQADIRIASEDATFAIPAARLGLGYAAEGVQALINVVGPANASEILLSARRFSTEEAYRMGLVNRVVSRAQLAPSVFELAHQIADNAPLTLRAAKAAIRESLKDPGQRDLEHVNRSIRECFESSDYAEGRLAFREKRRPRFEGK